MKTIHKNSELNEYIDLLAPEELTVELIDLFNDFRLEDKRYENEISRHRANVSVEDAEYMSLVLEKAKSTEDIAIENETIKYLNCCLNDLTPKQSLRIKMMYFDGLTIREIAKLEQCHFTTVEKSIAAGINKIREKFNNFDCAVPTNRF